MRPRPRPAMVRARRIEKIRGRSPPTKQGRRSRRDTNELRASWRHVRRIYLRTLQRVDFTIYLPRCRRRPAVGKTGKDSDADFLGRERFASLKRYLRARRANQGVFP